MIDGILIAVIVALCALSIRTILKKKAKGGCIGCPDSGCCGKNCGCDRGGAEVSARTPK